MRVPTLSNAITSSELAEFGPIRPGIEKQTMVNSQMHTNNSRGTGLSTAVFTRVSYATSLLTRHLPA
jgi:hypothetical protein